LASAGGETCAIEALALTRRFGELTAVDAPRAMMIQGGESAFGLGLDYGVQLAALALLTLIATRLQARIVT
jgi:hypothetical protein